ncbi:glycosyltransferase involved in cell wall biosynthesis [Salinibacter ruber]|uniref:glycosyltransferase n=1 Tax=Salinibacter ruber TaxID=146919 RepID=UPI0021694375|nr:glycosyltransferase [Salinibacter ruber]MCS3657965.1 glycosyltransferase involved in cell wall biosynthesis [Salinibacter ruber]
MDLLPITAIVVTYNEDEHLDECLNGISFCRQVVVADLGSKDRSIEISKKHGADVVHHERLPVVEKVRESVVDKAENDWVLFIDPDEIFPQSYARKIKPIIEDKSVGRVFFPWKFYFQGEPLDGTQWGGQKKKGILVHTDRCSIDGEVHQGITLKEEYEAVQIPWDAPSEHIRHYWMDNWSQLFEKHRRYVQQEGEVRFKNGERFSWLRVVHDPLQALVQSLIREEGWRDGATGIFLSFFHAWYVGACLFSLRRYQNSHSSP